MFVFLVFGLEQSQHNCSQRVDDDTWIFYQEKSNFPDIPPPIPMLILLYKAENVHQVERAARSQ